MPAARSRAPCPRSTVTLGECAKILHFAKPVRAGLAAQKSPPSARRKAPRGALCRAQSRPHFRRLSTSMPPTQPRLRAAFRPRSARALPARARGRRAVSPRHSNAGLARDIPAFSRSWRPASPASSSRLQGRPQSADAATLSPSNAPNQKDSAPAPPKCTRCHWDRRSAQPAARQARRPAMHSVV